MRWGVEGGMHMRQGAGRVGKWGGALGGRGAGGSEGRVMLRM